jgi:hypothetical protein
MKIPDEKMIRTKKLKKICSQTSQLEKPEEFELNHNHEKPMFLTVLLLLAQFKMNYW